MRCILESTAAILCTLLAASYPAICAAFDSDASARWIAPNERDDFPVAALYDNLYGKLGVLTTSGPVAMQAHPFFKVLGANGRACVSCHQPAYAMSVSAAGLRERWRVTNGKDPVFAAIDGANCPDLPQEQMSAHSLLLERGLFRIALPWPPKNTNPNIHSDTIKPEFAIEVVRDPTGCNINATYGLNSPTPTISVYRRPRPIVNMKYVMESHASSLFIIKNGMPAAIDPATQLPVAMNLLSDARLPTLKMQASDAARTHLQMTTPLSEEQAQQITAFELQIYAAQSVDAVGGQLVERGGSNALGPENLVRGQTGVAADNVRTPIFGFFDQWKSGASGASATQREFRASVARGNDLFATRTFWIRDAMHMNTVGLGNPIKRTCATCHNTQMTGMDLTAGWMDVGTVNRPWAHESPELPLFKITCDKNSAHVFLGRVIYSQDPGRALISGKCADVGAIVMQQIRGLAARAPYFSNGSAGNLRELVDFYDRRFNIGYQEQEKQDLVNFLSTL